MGEESLTPVTFASAEPAGETSGEKGGDDKSAGEESWMGEMGLLLIWGGGVADDKTGEEWLEGAGEIEGEEGPGVGWSVGATDAWADGG
jgi:hypothetical protein